MIALVLGALRARWAQAVTLAALAAAAAGAAVVGPAYLNAVDRAVVDREVAGATAPERTLTLSASVDLRARSGPSFAEIGTALVGIPGFTPVFSTGVNVLGVEASTLRPSSLDYRQGACEHLTMVRGRCLLGGGEVVIGERTAARRKLSPGDTLTITYTIWNDSLKRFVPAGTPATMTIAGVYRVTDPTALFWGTQAYFPLDDNGDPDEPVFTTHAGFQGLDHTGEQDTVEAIAGPELFTPERIERLRAELAELDDRLAVLGGDIATNTSLPGLLDRVDANRRQAHQLVPVTAVPLVMLAWFVIFLAVGYGTAARRRELGLLALRGTQARLRWALAGGEHLVPVAIGTAVGYPLGLLAARALAAARLHEPAGGAGVARYALGAGAGAVLAALLAQRRELFGPVAGLLRRVSGATRWRSAAGEAVVLVLAVAATLSLRASGGRLTGVGMLAPALLIAAVALVTARAVAPLAGRFGRSALRRGRVAAALAALQLSRRAGAHRLLVLLVAAVAVLAFAAAAFDTGARARADRAEIGAGAARVLTVRPMPRAKLLAAARAVDPAGRFAMAVAPLPDGAPGEPAKLAVDASRLAAVAIWRPEFGVTSPASLAALLDPPLPAPVVVTADRVAMDLAAVPRQPNQALVLTIRLAPLSGDLPETVPLGALKPGEQTLDAPTPGCHDGCRLVGFGVARPNGASFDATVTVHELRTTAAAAGAAGAATVAIPAASFGAPGAWRATSPDRAALSGDAGGLRIDLHVADGPQTQGWVFPADRPATLPVAATAALPDGTRLAGLDSVPTPVRQVARLAGLPRLGRAGALVDLAVADRMATDAGATDGEQVWLAPSAPADVPQRLKEQGVVVVDDSGRADARAALDAQGPALALWFYPLVAALAVLLAAGGLRLAAAVDRDRGAADLRALRLQGVPAGVAGRAGLLGYLVVVCVALLVGPLSAAVAWDLAGGSLPTAGDQRLWPAPRWPHAAPVLWPWAAAAVMLVAVAVVAAIDLRRKVREVL